MANKQTKAKNPVGKKGIAIGIIGAVVVLGLVSLVTTIIVTGQPPVVKMQYKDEKRSATITLGGNTEEVDVPTVESVDVDKSQTTTTEGEHGLGIWADVSSPEAFRDSTIGRCLDSDNYAGAQCWDVSNVFFENYAGRTFSTCGTGAAKGTIQDGCWQKNVGDEFVMEWNPDNLQPGDIGVWGTGVWGHTGVIMGYPNNGYITLLSQNQGGTPCPGGGSSVNIINISLKDFIGAFRPKAYIKPVEPVIPITGCLEWAVKRGDTMGKIMYECEGFLEYGDVMNKYADSWYSRYIKPGQSVYYGWTHGSGVGLYEHDTIDHKVSE